MTPDLFTIDVAGSLEPASPGGGAEHAASAGPQPGAAGGAVTPAELDDLVARGRQVHDDLLLARARGHVGFGDLYMLGREAMRAREAAESLAARFDMVAVMATGPEADVAASMLDALAHPYHNLLPSSGRAGRPRVVVVDSADPDRLGAFLESFPIEQSLFVVLSKSGSDVASLTQFSVAREMARKRVGPGFQDHIVVATDPRGGVLREAALREGLLSFEVPSNVPARYGALTPIGLLPAAIAGIDVRGVLGGAHGAAERTAGEDLRTNPAYLLASVLHLLAAARGRRQHLFVAASDGLLGLARHLARLFEESVGTAPAEPAALRTCEALSLARDFGTVAQRVASASAGLAVVIVEAGKPGRDRPIAKDGAGGDWLGGKNLSDVQAASGAALRGLLRRHGVPYAVLRLPTVSASSVGAVQMAGMLSAAFAGGLCGGDPFNAARPRAMQAVETEIGRPA